MMAEKKEDRRIVRTRMALHQALIELILEKRYDKITVQDIIDRADVGRSTFYAHFLDKEDLLLKGFALFSDELGSHLEMADPEHEEAEHVLHSLVFFQHANEHHELYKAMLEGGGADVLMAAGRSHLTYNIEHHLYEVFADGETAVMPIPVITNFLAGAMLSVLMWWLDEGRPYSPEKINQMFQQLATAGVEKLLHLA
jgi:AcrR family transcriptional regulator